MTNAVDQFFTVTATQLGQVAISESTIAQRTAPGFATAELATWQVAQNQFTNQLIGNIAASEGLPVVTDPTAANQQAASSLAGLSSVAFEQVYLNDQLVLGQQMLNAYVLEAQLGASPALKTYAASVLPTIVGQVNEVNVLLVALGQQPGTLPLPV